MRRRRNQKSALLTNKIKEKKNMSEPIQIPSKLKLQSSNQGSAAGSPLEVARVGIAPTSFTTRRTRTTSVTKKIDEKDLEDGTGFYFLRHNKNLVVWVLLYFSGRLYCSFDVNTFCRIFRGQFQ